MPYHGSATRTRAISSGLVVWWCATLYQVVYLASDSLTFAAEATQAGSLYNQIKIAFFACIGIGAIVTAPHPAIRRRSLGQLLPLIIYVVWAMATLLWTSSLEVSIRRLIQFVFILAGSVGLGVGFYGMIPSGINVLARHLMYAGMSTACLVLAISGGELNLANLLNPDWTSSARSIWGYLAPPILYALPSLWFITKRRRYLFCFVSVLFFLCLFMLKVRSEGIFAVMALVAVVWSARKRSLLSAVGLLLAGITFVISVLFLQDSLSALTETIMPYWARGERASTVESLTGRLPLWHYLTARIAERPLVGKGFGAFWTGNEFANAFNYVRWMATAAHNGFIDELLATGAVGLAAFLVFWGFGLAWSVKLMQQPGCRRSGALVMSWLLLFLLLNTTDSFLQEFARFPFSASLVGMFAISSSVSSSRIAGINIQRNQIMAFHRRGVSTVDV